MQRRQAYITGMTGTVAPFLKQSLIKQGVNTVGHHIHIHEVNQINLSLSDIQSHQVDMLFHLALGPIPWATALASFAYTHHMPFIYISTASVFDDQGHGPYSIHTEVKAKQGYGLYKYQCEQAVLQVHPQAHIIRIGWQIDPNRNSQTNNMFKFFHEQRKHQDKIKVSSRFFPSSSFLPDTTDAIVKISLTMQPGLYYVNGNHNLSLYDIAKRLNKRYHLDWIIEKDDSFSRNDILLDPRIKVPFL